jgi:ABC-type bacteriocin/lantibiotic exporter with double-glycine peptidase domain
MKTIILPETIAGFVVRFSGKHQIGLAILSIAVFLLSAAPLELQRRIVNDAIKSGMVDRIMWLAAAYAGVALSEQILKLALNVYRGWVAENSVRLLRREVATLREENSEDTGIGIAMMVSEVEPIGGFVGISVSEPLLQGGILVSVIGYMIFLEPWTAVLSMAFLAPQMIFVPLMQFAINRRARARIQTIRALSGEVVGTGTPRDEEIQRVFVLNMGIYKLKYSMNLAMNLMQYFSIAVALGVGGWFVAMNRIQIGTVVAVVAGLGKLNDPWGDLVNWGREFSVVAVKYRLFVAAVKKLTA